MENNKKTINGMNRLIGHAKSNVSMIKEGKYCIDIINQNQAVISALHRVNQQLLESHINTCVIDAIKSSSKEKRSKAIEELLKIYKRKD